MAENFPASTKFCGRLKLGGGAITPLLCSPCHVVTDDTHAYSVSARSIVVVSCLAVRFARHARTHAQAQWEVRRW